MDIASRLILIGGSAGSYSLISEILENLPQYFEQSICIVLHRNKKYDTQIEKSLSKKFEKNIISACDKMEIMRNHVYFAPAGYHMLVEPNFTFSLDCSEHVNYSRPSIDVLFETAAQVYKDKCTAILLSGANSDGAHGLKIIEKFGGHAIIHDPKEAIINTMPLAGQREAKSPTILTSAQIVQYFIKLN